MDAVDPKFADAFRLVRQSPKAVQYYEIHAHFFYDEYVMRFVQS